MVSQVSSFYSAPFKVYQCVMQGNSLLPKMFNFVADEIVRIWIMIMVD